MTSWHDPSDPGRLHAADVDPHDGQHRDEQDGGRAPPRPWFELPKALVNIWLAITCVSKLPLVVTFTMSKTFITVTISVVTTTPMVGAIWGIVTRQKIWLSVAPSIFAASVSSSGTALMADERMTMANPVWIQIRITISHMLLNGVSCRNRIVCGDVVPSSPSVKPPRPGPRTGR